MSPSCREMALITWPFNDRCIGDSFADDDAKSATTNCSRLLKTSHKNSWCNEWECVHSSVLIRRIQSVSLLIDQRFEVWIIHNIITSKFIAHCTQLTHRLLSSWKFDRIWWIRWFKSTFNGRVPSKQQTVRRRPIRLTLTKWATIYYYEYLYGTMIICTSAHSACNLNCIKWTHVARWK